MIAKGLTVLRKLRPDVIFFYCLQIGMIAIPLILVAFLARTIGANGLGLFAIGQAFAVVLSVVVDYGLSFTGTREVARTRNDPQALAAAVGPVLAAKLVLSMAALALAAVAYLLIPIFRSNPAIFILSTFYGILTGHNFYWFFGGIQRYMLSGLLDLGARLGGLVVILLIVRSPDDTWKAMAGLALSQFAVSSGAATILVKRHIVPTGLNWTGAMYQLKAGANLFVPNILGTIMVNANAMLMGTLASIHDTGIYSGAERIMRGASLPFYPLRQTLFPLFADAQYNAPHLAQRLFRQVMASVVVGGIFVSLVTFLSADTIVRYGLGVQFQESVFVLRVLCAVPMMNALADMFGTCWLIPRGYDGLCRTISGITFALHISLAIVFVGLFGAIGMAMAFFTSSTASAALLAVAIWRTGSQISGDAHTTSDRADQEFRE